MKTKKLKCRKGRINNTQFQGDVFVKTAIRIESSKRLRLKREKWSLLIAKERGVRVPEVIEYYVDKNGREVLKLKKIDAQILLHFPVSRQVEIMRRVGTEMLKLKSISKNFGWPHPETMKGEYKSWNLFLYDFVKTYGGKLTNHYIIDEKIVSNLLQELKQFDFNIQNSDLIHRDKKPNNILCSKDLSNFWIIDWENYNEELPIYYDLVYCITELMLFDFSKNNNHLDAKSVLIYWELYELINGLYNFPIEIKFEPAKWIRRIASGYILDNYCEHLKKCPFIRHDIKIINELDNALTAFWDVR